VSEALAEPLGNAAVLAFVYETLVAAVGARESGADAG
jgi:hypothetical protein